MITGTMSESKAVIYVFGTTYQYDDVGLAGNEFACWAMKQEWPLHWTTVDLLWAVDAPGWELHPNDEFMLRHHYMKYGMAERKSPSDKQLAG